ncbi:PAS domain S-box protein [Natranaerofaba carboxydovora]|uniref:PAS domain S-box protein n=1 Tax=Natranaerofaba carboxydovora TaxID=2742683 RepID=UPI001F1297EF|nr:PAS domain S-box protein [Natranaerofaba carboxydovora]UMZ72987.1 Phosphoserine phosphatase RsbU [Natranaerofaba carboxydovora]
MKHAAGNLLNGILESSKESVIFALDDNYCYLTFNQNHKKTMKNIWGVDIKVGDNMLDYIKYKEDIEKAKGNFDRALNGESFIEIEQYEDESIDRRWYQNEYNPLYDESGNIIGLTVFLSDITERKQTEEKLRKSEVKFRTYIEKAPIGIFVLDKEGNYLEVNEEACRMTGYTREEFFKLNIKDLLPADSYLEGLAPFSEVFEKGHTKNTIFTKRKDGTKFWRYMVAVKLDDDHVIGFASDITQLKEFEKELRLKDRALKSSINAVAMADLEGKLIFINQSFLDLWGYKDEDEVLGKNAVEFWEDRNKAREVIDALFNEGNWTGEMKAKKKDGELIDLHLSAAIVYNEERKVEALMASFVDISEQKKTQRQLKKYNNELKTKKAEVEKLYKHLNNEIDMAKEIHERALLKDPYKLTLPEDISIEAHYRPSEQLGGDFYSFIEAQNKLIIYLSDVSGHGLDGTMLSVFVKETIESYLSLRPNDISPENIIKHVNNQYYEDNPGDYFICIFLGILDLETYNLDYTGVGMQFSPKVKHVNGELTELFVGGLPISSAISDQLMNFESNRIQLNPGSTVLFYTDGLAEQKSQGIMYENRLKKIFDYMGHYPVEFIKNAMNMDFKEFNGGSLIGDDDITYVLLQRYKEDIKQFNWALYSSSKELDVFYTNIKPTLEKYVANDVCLQCLHELMTNAMEHGNKFDPDKMLYIEATVCEEFVVVSLSDDGEGFNWTEKLKKTCDIDFEGERGRGIIMAQLICDRLYYNEKGNKAFVILEGI